MKIDFKEIKEMLQTSSLTEVSRQTGIPLRTLENYKYGTNNSFQKMEETLSALQKYINKKGENKMKTEKLYQADYEFVENLGDYDLFIKPNDDKHNQFNEVYVRFHDNVNRKNKELLIEKNAVTEIERMIQEINASEEREDSLYLTINEYLDI